jgi:hypothetical protein
MFERVLIAALALGMVPVQAEAQDWRNVTSFRQRAQESRLDVHVRYGAGMLSIRPGGAGELYRTDIRYDSDTFEPVTDYRDGRLDVGVEGRGRGIKIRNTESGEMRLALSPDVPLDLDLDFGAVEANIELGGLRLARADIETGASETQIRFSEPNRGVCESLRIQMGAAALEARGLGNANCARVRAEGGVGDLTLDFSGAWRGDMDAEVTIALGSLTLRVPENVGVRVDKDTFLADFSGPGFYKRDGSHYSENWGTAEHHLTVQVEGAFGTIDVRWIAPAEIAP